MPYIHRDNGPHVNVWATNPVSTTSTMNIEDFQVGIEVETPVAPHSGDDPLRTYGQNSSSFYDSLRHEFENSAWPHGGKITSDISVGAEIVSGPDEGDYGGIPIEEAAGWYDDTIAAINDRTTHVPVGLMNSSNQTAGLHIHFSHPNTDEVRDFAEWLYNRSRDDEWLRVFACSSIADQNGAATAQVFRGDRHCTFNGFGHGRPNAVTEKNPSRGHYEWRMPEPMTVENFSLMMEFLERAIDDRDAAVEWASELVYGGDSRLTSVQRAEATGFDSYEPPTTIDGLQVVRGVSHGVHAFYNSVYERSDMPFAYRVHTEDGRFADTYYLMVSNTRAPSDWDVPEGYSHVFPDANVDRWVIEDTGNGGLRLADDDVERDIIDAANHVHESNEVDGGFETSDATDVLMEAL